MKNITEGLKSALNRVGRSYTLRKFGHRITYRPDGVRRNSLSYIFFFQTLAFGVAYTFFGHTDTVSNSILYVETQNAFGFIPLPIWGVCAMLVTVANIAGILTEKVSVVKSSALVGFMLWLFASIVYLLSDSYFQLAVGGFVQVYFWIWYYFRVGRFARNIAPVVQG